MQEKTAQLPRSAKRGGRTRSRPMEKTMVRKAVPLQPMKDHGVIQPHCSLGGAMAGQAGRAGGGWSSWKAAAGAVFWQEL